MTTEEKLHSLEKLGCEYSITSKIWRVNGRRCWKVALVWSSGEMFHGNDFDTVEKAIDWLYDHRPRKSDDK